MIRVLQLVGLLLYGVWRMRRMARARQVKSSRDYRVVATAGLEDASTCEPVSDGSWTALDERQLIRLLTDSAP